MAELKDYNLERFKLIHRLEGMANALDGELAELLEGSLERIEQKLVKLAGETGKSLVRARKYLEARRPAIEKTLREVYQDMGRIIEDKAIEVGQGVPNISYKTLLNCTTGEVKKAVEKLFSPIKLSKDRLKHYLESTRVEGLYFNEWLKKLEENAVARIIKETQTSLILEEPWDQTQKRLQKALATSRKSAQGLTRNAIFQSFNWAEREYQMQHEERLKGFRFTAQLDARTTDLCRSLDQQLFPTNEAPVPPLHWLCRSYLVPVFFPIKIGDKEIDLEEAIQGKRIVRIESDPRWINHKDGTRTRVYRNYDVEFVSGKMSYNEMMQKMALSRDPAHRAFAREALGPTRFNLVSSGKLKINSLYYRGKLKTIKELEAML